MIGLKTFYGFTVMQMLVYMHHNSDTVRLEKLHGQWHLYVLCHQCGEFESTDVSVTELVVRAFKPHLPQALAQRARINQMNNETVRRAQFYLHTNGQIIAKPLGGVDENSDFVEKVWQAEDVVLTPEDFVNFLRDAFIAGATFEEIHRLASHHQLDVFHSNWEQVVFKR